MYHYFYYSISIFSEIKVPELPDATEQSPEPIFIRVGTTPPRLEGPDVVTKVRNQISPNKFLLQVAGVAAYFARDGRDVTIQPTPGADEASIRVFLLGTVIASLMRQRGCYLLHASSVARDGKAIAFAGRSGSGKSTLAATLLERGYQLLCDDVCYIKEEDGSYYVVPGYPILKLWNDSIDRVYPEGKEFSKMVGAKQIRDGVGKYKLDRRILQKEFSSTPVKLAAIYFIGQGSEVSGTEIKGFETMKHFMGASYLFGVLQGTAMEKPFFEFSVRMAKALPIRKLTRGRLISDYEPFVDVVESDLQEAGL